MLITPPTPVIRLSFRYFRRDFDTLCALIFAVDFLRCRYADAAIYAA